METLNLYIWAKEPVNCSNNKCKSSIGKGSEFFADGLTGENYCTQCGTCLRYHRKKALQRGEPATLYLNEG